MTQRLFDPSRSLLAGTWKGAGSGNYPTIDAFEYEETLRFELDPAYPMIRYEQRTYLKPDREPSHWEVGFIRPIDGGFVEFSSAQDSGRVEVLRGFVDPAGADRGELRLELNHVALSNEDRLVRTRRRITLIGDTLSYVMFMATNTTEEPRLLQHLEAILQRT